jgi:hypothetical protein
VLLGLLLVEAGAPGALGQLAAPAGVAAVRLRPQLLPCRGAAAWQQRGLPRRPGALRLEDQEVQEPHLRGLDIGFYLLRARLCDASRGAQAHRHRQLGGCAVALPRRR